VVVLQLEDGCSTVTVSRTDLGWDRYTEWTWGVSINMEAQVKEKGTGIFLSFPFSFNQSGCHKDEDPMCRHRVYDVTCS